MQQLEEAYWDEEEVVFLYVQTVFEGDATNTWDNGLADLDDYGLKGSYGFDPGGGGPPETMVMFTTQGTPWSVVINRKGKEKVSEFTPDFDAVAAAIDKAL